MRQNQRKWLTLVVLISLLLHVLALWVFEEQWALLPPTEPPPPETVFVNLPKNDLPIVVAPEPAIKERPDKPSAQGLYDQKVKEETVSPNSKLSEGGGGKKAPRAPKKPSPSSAQQKREKPKESPSETKPSWQPDVAEVPEPQEPQRVPQKQPPKEEKMPGFPDAAPGVSAGGEYRPNFKMGGRTYLNIMSNEQIFYFVELKRKLQMAWSPRSAIRGGRAGEHIAVVLAFSISSNGKLIHATVLDASGVPAYDAEAKRAVTASAPFSPPPGHLLKEGRLDLAIPFVTHFR